MRTLCLPAVGGLLLLPCLPAQEWRRRLPPLGDVCALTFDMNHNRSVLVGGGLGNELLETWEYDGATRVWQQATTFGTPPSRVNHALAWDILRGRIVLFGGTAPPGGVRADTWEYDPGTRTWNELVTSITPPGRSAHAMAYDLLGQRTVMFGGFGNVQPGGANVQPLLNDTWEFDGIDWHEVTTSGQPVARSSHGFAFDLQRGRGVLFGGSASFGLLNDTWEYDPLLRSWTALATAAAPQARKGAALVHDLQHGRMTLFGGFGGGSHFGDTWTFDGSNWTQRATPTAPVARGGHAFAYDATRGQAVLFAGRNSTNTIQYGDTWEYDGAVWNEAVADPGSHSRFDAGVAYDRDRNRLVMFGGANLNGFTDAETWEHDGTVWQRRSPANAPSSRRTALAYDSARRRTVLFGGATTTGVLLDDTWEYDGTNWIARTPAHVPMARTRHALVHDLMRARVVLFGGIDALTNSLADTWEYDGNDWRAVTTAAVPPARRAHALVYHSSRARTVMFGGLGVNSQTLGDTWEYDGTNWQQITTGTFPPARSLHAMAYDVVRGRTILSGGSRVQIVGLVVFSDTWEYDGASWNATTTPGPARQGHVLLYDNDRQLTLLGGSDALSLRTDTWHLLPRAVPNWARHGLGCVGSNGIPTLDASTPVPPALGSLFTLRLLRLPLQPGAAFLAFGFDLVHWNGNLLPAPLDSIGLPGCNLWIAPLGGAAVLVPHAGISAAFPIAIPANPALGGMVVGCQAIVADSAAPSGIASVTNAVILRLY